MSDICFVVYDEETRPQRVSLKSLGFTPELAKRAIAFQSLYIEDSNFNKIF